jgi:quinol-cytochrome oxidoreductase complex cytochrome b subunit
MIMEAILRKNPKLWMVAIYLFLVAGFLYLKPAVAFGENGRIRPFGVGKRESTVFPVWFWMFVFAVVSYFSVVYVLDFSL